MGISLIFYGENESEYGNPLKDSSSAQRDWEYFSGDDESNTYLSGVSIQSLRENFGLNHGDLEPYMPANPEVLAKNQTEVHYLGYYLPWHPQGAYYYAVEHGGLKASPSEHPVHIASTTALMIKLTTFITLRLLLSLESGRASYDAAQEIRNDEITREEGVALVKKFDGEFPERFADEIFAYLSIPEHEFPIARKMFEEPMMDRNYFDALTDTFRSPHLWINENGKWVLRETVFMK